jgi:hypothetical protein
MLASGRRCHGSVVVDLECACMRLSLAIARELAIDIVDVDS